MTSQSFFEKKQAAENLLKKDDILLQIVWEMCDMITVWDAYGRIVHSSSKRSDISAPDRTASFLHHVHERFRKDLVKAFRRIKRTRKVTTIQYQYQNSGENWLWFESICMPLLNDRGETSFVIVTTKDITMRKRTEENLKNMAFHDPLTGLPNRRLFQEHFAQAITYAKRNEHLVALLYMDIDDFKLINDCMGHEMGDNFLQEFAKRVKSCIREIDTFARIGGDEFTIVLPVIDSLDNVEKVVKRIYAAVSEPWKIKNHSFVATVSTGVAVYPLHGSNTETLYRNADRALYQAKDVGRNAYKFYEHD